LGWFDEVTGREYNRRTVVRAPSLRFNREIVMRLHARVRLVTRACALLALVAVRHFSAAHAQQMQPDWPKVEQETLRHYQAVLRLDTSNPPSNEHIVAEYVKGVLEAEGIPAKIFALDPNRSNVVARLTSSGKRRPILIMGHSDVVTVGASKWKHPPFSATRDGGYVYGRGTIDDKDNLTAGLMTLLLLKRLNVPLDRDVISCRRQARKARPTSASSSCRVSTSTKSRPNIAWPKAAARSASGGRTSG
jgi:hypothetical protein